MSSPQLHISVQEEDFDCSSLQAELLAHPGESGAVASFTGCVRGQTQRGRLHWMELEHYPGMTEQSLRAIALEAAERWPLQAVTVVHRVGRLEPGAQIVWVGCAAAHRGEAFEACEFLMDYLKTRAPFWKRESGDWGESWVEARQADDQRAERWQRE